MRIIGPDDTPAALAQRAFDARAAAARDALSRLVEAPPGATPPAARLPDAVQLSPSAFAAYQRHLRSEADLAALAALLREAAGGALRAVHALRQALLARGADPVLVPVAPAALAPYLLAVRALFPHAPGDSGGPALAAAWLLAARSGATAELPPALLAFLARFEPPVPRVVRRRPRRVRRR